MERFAGLRVWISWNRYKSGSSTRDLMRARINTNESDRGSQEIVQWMNERDENSSGVTYIPFRYRGLYQPRHVLLRLLLCAVRDPLELIQSTRGCK